MGLPCWIAVGNGPFSLDRSPKSASLAGRQSKKSHPCCLKRPRRKQGAPVLDRAPVCGALFGTPYYDLESKGTGHRADIRQLLGSLGIYEHDVRFVSWGLAILRADTRIAVALPQLLRGVVHTDEHIASEPAGYDEGHRSRVYVDKSGLIFYINRVLGADSKHIYVSRSRRFGKTMAANKVSAHYDRTMEGATEFASLAHCG